MSEGEPQASVNLVPDVSGWPLPTGIPSLGDVFPKQILNLLVRSLIGRHPFVDDKLGHSHFVNLVRVVDKSVREYELARYAADEFVAHMTEGRLSPYFRAVDHFESSIGATYRALCYSDRLRRLGASLPVSKNEIVSSRERVRKLRDRIEHGDEDIAQARVPVDSAPFLMLMADALTVGNETMAYADFGGIVRANVTIVEALMSTSD